MQSNDKIRLLLVDDHPSYRQALAYLLEDYPDLEISDQAETGAEALEKFDPQKFDVILLDIRLPDISGIDIAYQFRQKDPQARIIMLSMRDEDEVIESLPKDVPFISKAASPDDVVGTIRNISG